VAARTRAMRASRDAVEQTSQQSSTVDAAATAGVSASAVIVARVVDCVIDTVFTWQFSRVEQCDVAQLYSY